ncbi:MAG: hypothetical protein MUO54_02480 [Anaerolineales bacterium]|nr:hypothetical protein [Anaerolineales bacterium]
MRNKSKKIFSPMRIAILGSVILGLLHSILLGGIYQRNIAVQKIHSNTDILAQNLNDLQDINDEQISALRYEFGLIQSEVDELQNSFPDLGAAFAIFHRGPDLSERSGVTLDSIIHQGSELQEIVSGTIQADYFSIELTGTLETCLAFIEKLETAGLDTVTMESVDILPEENNCSLEIKTVSYPTNRE